MACGALELSADLTAGARKVPLTGACDKQA
jgi:hypothetical protein